MKEYNANTRYLVDSEKEIAWLRKLLKGLPLEIGNPSPLGFSHNIVACFDEFNEEREYDFLVLLDMCGSRGSNPLYHDSNEYRKWAKENKGHVLKEEQKDRWTDEVEFRILEQLVEPTSKNVVIERSGLHDNHHPGLNVTYIKKGKSVRASISFWSRPC